MPSNFAIGADGRLIRLSVAPGMPGSFAQDWARQAKISRAERDSILALPVDDPVRVAYIAAGEAVTSTPDDGALTLQMDFERLLSVNGAVLTGSADDQPGIYYALQNMKRSGHTMGLSLPKGVSNGKLNNTVDVDVSLFSFGAKWTKFDCGGLPAGASAFRLIGTEETLTNVMGRNKMGGIHQFELVGGDELGTTIGVDFQGVSTDLGPGPGRCLMQQFLIHDFGIGVRHHHHAYGECVQHGDINNCNILVQYNPSGTSKDMGEQSKYFDVFLYQAAGWGISNEGVHGTWLKLLLCHLDHNQRQIRQMNRGRTMFGMCHLEAADYQVGAPVLLDASGGMIEFDGLTEHVLTGANPSMPFYVENNAPRNGHHGVFFKGRPNFYKLKSATRYLSTGIGLTRVPEGFTSNVDISSAAVRNPTFISANIADKTVPDRGFDAATLLRRVQITQDTAAITSPLTGTALSVARATASPRSVTFVGSITGNTLTYTSGTRPYVGMTLSGSGVTACTVTGTGTTANTYTVSVSQNVAGGTTFTGVGVGYLEVTKTGAASAASEVWVPLGKIRSLNSRGTFGAWFWKDVAGNVPIRPGYASWAETGNGNRVLLSFTPSEPTQTFSATNTWTRIESPDAGVVAAELDNCAEEYGFFADITLLPAGKLRVDDDEASVI